MPKVPGIVMTAWLLAILPAGADEAAFFRGKTIQFTSAFAEGGLYATVTRLVSEHLPRHLPGRPGGIAVSMPGAAGLRQMNHLYNVAPKDGTVIARDVRQRADEPGDAIRRVDPLRRAPVRRARLGRPRRDRAHQRSQAHRRGELDDARRIPVVFGATGTTSGQYYLPSIINRLFGTRFRIIPGYKTTAEIFLSMERGELDGVSGAFEAILEGRPQWVAEARFNQLAQLYDARPAQFADVPLLQELAQAPIDQAAFRFLALARIPGKMLLVPPGVPAERLAALREAFATMVRDPVFVADVARTSQRLEPRTWQDAERIIRETIETPPEVVAHVRDLLKVASP